MNHLLSASKSSVRRGARRCSILPQSNVHDASLRRVLASNLKIHPRWKCLLDFVVDRNACYCDILCIVCDLQRKFQLKQNLREITYQRFVRQLKRCSTQHPRKHRCLNFGSSDNHSRSTGAQSADASEVRNAPWTAGAYQTQWCTHRLSRHCGAYVSHAFKPLTRSPPICMRAITISVPSLSAHRFVGGVTVGASAAQLCQATEQAAAVAASARSWTAEMSMEAALKVKFAPLDSCTAGTAGGEVEWCLWSSILPLDSCSRWEQEQITANATDGSAERAARDDGGAIYAPSS